MWKVGARDDWISTIDQVDLDVVPTKRPRRVGQKVDEVIY